MEFKDIIISNTVIKFDLVDRIRILFGKSCHVEISTETENLPGHVESTDRVFVEKIFPRKKVSGGGMECSDKKPKGTILSPEEEAQEIKELILLQDPICGKHHG